MRAEPKKTAKAAPVRGAMRKAIRESLALSQRQFADLFGFKLQTLQSWERKSRRRKPTRTARVLLTALRHKPEAVLEALVEQRG